MYAELELTGIDETEACAKEILEHIEAIKCLQRSSKWGAISVKITTKKDGAASGN